MNLLILFFASIVTSNIALTFFLGMCPFITISKNMSVAFGMGIAVTFVMTVTGSVNWVLLNLVLEPLGLEYLQFLVFIVSIATLVQVIEMFLDRYVPVLYHAFGIFLPLITVNCAILGVSIFIALRAYSFLQSLTFGLGSGIGWTFAIVAIGAMRRRLIYTSPLKHFGDAGITAILAGFMALAFIGFTGIVSM